MPTGIDTNVLVHAHNLASEFHPTASKLIQEALDLPGTYALAASCVAEFRSVISDPRRVAKPLPPAEASRFALLYLHSPSIRILLPDANTFSRAMELAGRLGVRGARTFDLIVAQTLLDHGVSELLTQNVKDFGGVPGLTARDPFA